MAQPKISKRAGLPGNKWNPHRSLGLIKDGTVNGAASDYPLADGTALPNNQESGVIVAVANARTMRIRAKVSGGASTLRATFLRPDGQTAYSANNPADVALADGVENKMDITGTGEGWLQVQILSVGAGRTLNYIDIMQCGPENDTESPQ